MAGPDVKLELAGGMAEEGALGTDAVRVMEAIDRADSGDGVLVLMDLGSAVLSAETALDFLTPEQRESVLLCEAPLVEGAVAAAVAATLGEPLAEVAKEARGGLQGKVAQLGAGEPAAPGPAGTSAPLEEGLTLRLDIRNPLGLHARPAARFVQTAAGFDANVQVMNLTSGRGPASGRSLNGPARHAIFDDGKNAAEAWHEAAEAVADDYRALDDEYLQVRAEDLTGVARQVVAALTGVAATGTPSAPGIVVAADLTPADTASLDRDLALGIATAAGSPTSHSAILARSLGIPAAVGLGEGLLSVPEGAELLLDGDAGTVHVDPDAQLAAEYKWRSAEREQAARSSR